MKRKRIKFNYYEIQYSIDKGNYNLVSERRNAEKLNRKISKIELYMKLHELLFPYEYIEFVDTPQSHIRIPYIELICKNNCWIESNVHLKILK